MFEEFWKDGYLCPAGSIDVSAAANEYINYLAGTSGKASKTFTTFNRFNYFSKDMNPHLVSKEVRRLVLCDEVVSTVKLLLGEDIVCINSIFIAKPPNSRDHLTPHQDAVYWGLTNNQAVSVWIALTDSNKRNGCVRVLPGSHKTELDHTTEEIEGNILQMNESCADQIDQVAMVPLELRAGEFSIHHCQVVHMSERNESDEWRIGLVARYAHRSALDKDYHDKRLFTELSRENEGIQECENSLIGEKERHIFNRKYFRKLNDSALKKQGLHE